MHTILEAETLGWRYLSSDLDTALRESEANMRLIAAAPELRDALKLAEEFVAGFENDDCQIGIGIKLAIIRSAIAKADGGEL
ncbi:hypothetical protein ASL20_09835 [Cupriavidus necator]|nr:hypothetical protein ASL20_09835 [Cupriavidus necator]